MRTITTVKTVYSFDELSEDAQEKAVEKLYDLNVDYDWWEFVFEDASEVGLKLTSFDIDRGRSCKGEFIEDALFTADRIIETHGSTCDTYKTAAAFLKERDEAVNNAPRDENGDFEDEDELDRQLDDIENDFLTDLLADYLSMLIQEYEYKTSREAIIETIKINNYEFDEDGNLA